MAPEYWKSVRGQDVAQTSALSQGGSKEVKMRLNSFGTGISEVCEGSECVANQYFMSERVQGCQNWV